MSQSQNRGDTECPICGRGCADKQGLAIHMGHAHPGSRTETVKCDYCGKSIERYKSEIEHGEKNFCDRQCQTKWQSENRTGPNNADYNRITTTCANCGKEASRTPTEFYGKRNHFCSQNCFNTYKIKTGEYAGVNDPKYERLTKECETCEEEFSIQPNRENTARFCSRDCFHNWRASHFVGENHPNWVGGLRPSYGPDWDKIRLKILNRDNYTCQACATDKSDEPSMIDVHHIRPIRMFGSHSKANQESNLVSLCKSCHGRWEGIPIRPNAN